MLPDLRAGEPVRARITVWVVAESRIHRDALACIVEAAPQLELVGACATDEAPRRAAAVRADVILLDVAGSPMGAAVEALSARLPAAKMVVLACRDDAADGVALVEAGAASIVSTSTPAAGVIDVIEAAVRGEFVCSGHVGAAMAAHIHALAVRNGRNPLDADLTAREQQVAILLARSLSDKEIAAALSIQESTAKHHVSSVIRKLQVKRRWQVAEALRRTRGTAA